MQPLKFVFKIIQGKYPLIYIQTPQNQAPIAFIPGLEYQTWMLFLEIVPLP